MVFIGRERSTNFSQLAAYGFLRRGLVLVAMCLLPQPAVADWPTTVWTVQCSSQTYDATGPASCEENGAGAATVHRHELEEASRWLEGFGFRKPNVLQLRAQPGAPFFAQIADERLGEDVGGSYNPPDNTSSTGSLDLSSDIAGQALGGESIHELFHAIQQTYHALDPLYADSIESGLPYPPQVSEAPLLPDHHWITEGTADAIRIAFGQHAGLGYAGRPKRQYDTPLHLPCTGCTPMEQRLLPYNTANFWLALGDMLGSPDRIAYLERIWSAIGADADVAHQGIGPVDSALRGLSGDGLATHFPAFIAQYARGPEFFKHVRNIELREGADRESRQGEAKPLAADAYRVRVAIPEGQTTELEIEIIGDHPALHLVVDGQLYDEPVPDRERNQFRRDLKGRPEPYEFFVRVANVAEDAATSSKRSYTLRAALPAEPLAGNMTAHFNGTFQGAPNEIPFTEKAAMRWKAVLDIKTGSPEVETDPVTEKEQIVYPDDGSEWMLSGSYLHERCVPRQPEVCNYWTEETFESDGSIAESGGDLWIVSEGDGVRLEARLPVTVTTTVHDSFLGEQSESRHFWTLSCPSSGRWWGQEPGLTHFPPLNGALHGSWASDDREVVEFTCHEEWQPWIYGPDSGETSSTSMSLQGRVEVQFR